MKKPLLFLLTFLSVCLAFSLGTAADALAEDVYVTVRESKLRPKPDFFSAGIADLKYGDRLQVVSSSEPWLTVKTAGGRSGYVHQSAISEKRVVLRSSASFDAAGQDSNDVVLAGKGFSAAVEKQFASQNSQLNFADVNAMERIKVSPKDVANFVQQGKLKQDS